MLGEASPLRYTVSMLYKLQYFCSNILKCVTPSIYNIFFSLSLSYNRNAHSYPTRTCNYILNFYKLINPLDITDVMYETHSQIIKKYSPLFKSFKENKLRKKKEIIPIIIRQISYQKLLISMNVFNCGFIGHLVKDWLVNNCLQIECTDISVIECGVMRQNIWGAQSLWGSEATKPEGA